jgi:membrane-bound ClpP family serine protease
MERSTMNVLKVLFGAEEEENAFFENTYPLTDDLFGFSNSFQENALDPIALVCEPIHPGRLGRVKFRGVRWRACSDRPEVIPEGLTVRVVGRRSNVLVVAWVETSALNH